MRADKTLIEIWPQSSDALNLLGNTLRKAGRFKSAVLCYRRVVSADPTNSEAYYNLGLALKNLNRTGEAIEAVRSAIESNPNNGSATHMLAAWTGKRTRRAPQAYIKNLFDMYAENFDVHLVGKLGYRAPHLLRLAVERVVRRGPLFRNVLDLGCGTGLVGEEFRDLAKRLSGVDLSRRMVQQAAKKSIYDLLCVNEITRYLYRSREEFDLFLAADVFIYCGDLRRIFKQVSQHALPVAYFAFSTEDCHEDSFVLRETGRYAHSSAYIRGLAREFEFEVQFCKSTTIRKDDSSWTPGRVYVLKKVSSRRTLKAESN